MSINGALQQVFAHCAEPVQALVDEKLAAESAVASPTKSRLDSVSSTASSATPATASSAATGLAGFDGDLVSFLTKEKLHNSESLLKALLEMEVTSMASVETGLLDGLLTVEDLKANGCKPIPASQFLKVAKAVSS
jgi:hypothetical protein